MEGIATSKERIGRYRLGRRLGEGGMGVVYLGLDPEGRKVAIKVLRPGVADDRTALRRLAREVDTMRRVHSPHVAEVLDADVTAEQPYVVTQFVPGRTLEQQVEEDGPVDGHALLRLAEGLAEALAAIHAAGVIHRDLKPANVMFIDGEPIVIDFGIAQAVDATRLTATGMVIGTPGYLAPEVIEGDDVGAASDVHSWASTMAFAATGRAPFGSGTYESIFYKIMNGRPDLDGVPGALLPLIRAAMAQNPAERPTAARLARLASRIDLTVPVSTLVEEPAPTRRLTAAHEPPPARPEDFKGLLPPVTSPPSEYDRYSPQAPHVEQRPASYPPPAAQPEESKPYGWYRLLGLLLLIGTVGLALMLPMITMLVVLAALALLRTGDRAARQLESRRIRRGPSVGDVATVVVRMPIGAVRAALATAVLTPIAFMVAVVVLLVCMVAAPDTTVARAISWGMAGFAVVSSIGPGSEGARRQLARIWGVIVPRREHALIFASCLAVVDFFVFAFALTQVPVLDPFDFAWMTESLSSLKELIRDLLR